MRSALALAALLFSQSVAAAACSKVEYADARDWSVADLERQFCEDRRQMYVATFAAGKGSVRDMRYLHAEANQCAEQMALYERVLKNVHKRPTPTCAP